MAAAAAGRAAGSDRYGGGGGGGRGLCPRLFLASELGSSETVTIGAGGAGGAAGPRTTPSGAAGTVGAIHPSAQFLLPMAQAAAAVRERLPTPTSRRQRCVGSGHNVPNASPASCRLGGMYSAPSGWGRQLGRQRCHDQWGEFIPGDPWRRRRRDHQFRERGDGGDPGGSNVGRDSGGGT